MSSIPDDNASPPPGDLRTKAARRHWRSVLRLTVSLLVVWFIAGPVLGILAADRLNTLAVGGFPVGFWFAQQGSILIFLLLIAIYAVVMNQLDRRYRREIGATRLDATTSRARR